MPITNTQRRQTKTKNNPFLRRSSKIRLGHALSLSFVSPSGVKSARLSLSLPFLFSSPSSPYKLIEPLPFFRDDDAFRI